MRREKKPSSTTGTRIKNGCPNGESMRKHLVTVGVVSPLLLLAAALAPVSAALEIDMKPNPVAPLVKQRVILKNNNWVFAVTLAPGARPVFGEFVPPNLAKFALKKGFMECAPPLNPRGEECEMEAEAPAAGVSTYRVNTDPPGEPQEEVRVSDVVAETSTVSPHYYVNLAKSPEGAKIQTISYGHLTLPSELGTPTECENAIAGYFENPMGGGPGKGVTEAFDAYNCHNTECEAAGGHIGVIFENANAPGLRTQISWPSELIQLAGTIRLESSNLTFHVHCQSAYTAPTERPGEESFTSLEERDTVEYNTGTRVTGAGVLAPREISGTSPNKPAESEFSEAGGIAVGRLAAEAYSSETNVPSTIQTKKG